MTLRCFVDGRLWRTVEPPREIAPRAWILGVVAVQLAVEEGRVVAQARTNRTGDEAETVALEAPALVQIAIGEAPLERVAIPPLADAAVRVQAFLDGEIAGEAILPRAALAADPPARGFGHVFCRWLREGGVERGFDLTAFASVSDGGKFERIVSRPIAGDAVVSYAVVF